MNEEGLTVRTPYRLAGATSEVQIDVPASALDLPSWLFSFSDTEYQNCSRGHFGAGMGTLPDGRRTSVNVESVGGHLAVQHYVEEISEPDHLLLVSEKTDAWLFHLFHVRPRVTWEMRLIPASADSCLFRCTVSVEHPSLFLKAASLLTLFQFFVERHDREETKLFAESLARRRFRSS
jgi:hypothetical protein